MQTNTCFSGLGIVVLNSSGSGRLGFVAEAFFRTDTRTGTTADTIHRVFQAHDHRGIIGEAIVVIVGRPNVGKSTLFNRLVGRRQAIVHDLPGITRDRIAGRLTLDDGRRIELIDTGGYGIDDAANLSADVERRIATGGRLLPAGIPRRWLGANFEVHGIPTAVRSTVSFAVRWHGERPAVLWEQQGEPQRLTAPGVDPDWSTDQVSGEALWAAPPQPKRIGVSIDLGPG